MLKHKMLQRKFMIGALTLALAACTSGGSRDDDFDSTDGVAADTLKDDTTSDKAVKDDEGLLADQSADAPAGTIKPDLAQNTMSDDLESELNSVASDAKSPAAPQNTAMNDDMSLGNDAAAPPVAAASEPPAATDASPTDMPIVAETAHEEPQAPALIAAEPPPATDAAPPAETPAVEANASAPAAAPGQSVEIRNIRYVSNKNGGTVVVDSSAPVTYRTRDVPGQNQFVIEISGAHLPSKLKRPFLTKDFRQSIASIDAYQEAGSSTARVVVQFRGPSSAAVRQEGNSLTVAAAGAGQIDDDATSTADAGGNSTGGNEVAAGSAEPFAAKSSSDVGGDPTHFFGKPISIEVRNTDIRDVINLIAEQSGANIVVSDNVKGDVTLKLKQVPWDQALLIIMKSKGLGYARQGSVLRIAPDEQLQKEADDMKKIQDSKNLAMPLRVRVVPLGYAKVEDIVPEVKDFLSARGKIAPDKRTSALVITDIPENLDRVTNLVRALDTPPLQVLIEGKVVEAREAFTNTFGINWGLSGGSMSSGSATLSPNFNISPGIVPGGGALGAITWGTLGNIGSLQAQLGLAEQQGITKVLSSPRVVTLNNETATIKQVQQIAIPTTTTTASTTPVTSFTYKPIELSLNVTPQITSTSDVLLNVTVKREFVTASSSGQSVPDVESREAQTKVMVRSGQTAVIGGIYQNDESVEKDGVPGLKDMPVVGWLFKNEKKQRNKNELLIFLTPKILKEQQTRMASEKAPGVAPSASDEPDISLE